MSKDRISLVDLARVVHDSYSRPPALMPNMFVEIVYLWSKRGTTDINSIEIVARRYYNIYPNSSATIDIFLKKVQDELL